jgi:hypothetical protein
LGLIRGEWLVLLDNKRLGWTWSPHARVGSHCIYKEKLTELFIPFRLHVRLTCTTAAYMYSGNSDVYWSRVR